MQETFRPVGESILVRRSAGPETFGNIVLTEQTKQAERIYEATVLAIGDGRWKKTVRGKDVFEPCPVRPGDRILFNEHASLQELELNGEKLHVMPQQHVMAKVLK